MKLFSLRTLVMLLSLSLLASCGGDDPMDPECTVGAACNDNNAGTENDVFNDLCECEGTAIPCFSDGGDNDGDGVCADDECNDNDAGDTSGPGDACDDGNPDTENDALQSDCTCAGTCTITDDPCDDGDDNTYNDVYNENCECEGTPYGSLTDPRDAQVYKTVEIGTQTWMAENLNYDGGVEWCFANTPANCDEYGRLYDWETATQGCPTGWHLPDDADWDILINFLGGQNVAGGALKEAGTDHWDAPNAGATNISGFTALPGGFRLIGLGMFQSLGTNGTWWSASEDQALAAWHRNMLFGGEAVTRGSSLKGDAFSVRCVQD